MSSRPEGRKGLLGRRTLAGLSAFYIPHHPTDSVLSKRMRASTPHLTHVCTVMLTGLSYDCKGDYGEEADHPRD